MEEKVLSKLILTKAFKKINDEPLDNIGCTVGLIDENDIYNWKCTLMGPNHTPYKGGVFKLFIEFPKTFPKEGPEVIFNTPIYHLNVNPIPNSKEKLGHCCLSTINFWTPDTSIEDLLISIFALFEAANPDSAYGLDYKQEYNENINLYNSKAKYFTNKYATGEQYNLKNWDFTLGKDFKA